MAILIAYSQGEAFYLFFLYLKPNKYHAFPIFPYGSMAKCVDLVHDLINKIK